MVLSLLVALLLEPTAQLDRQLRLQLVVRQRKSEPPAAQHLAGWRDSMATSCCSALVERLARPPADGGLRRASRPLIASRASFRPVVVKSVRSPSSGRAVSQRWPCLPDGAR